MINLFTSSPVYCQHILLSNYHKVEGKFSHPYRDESVTHLQGEIKGEQRCQRTPTLCIFLPAEWVEIPCLLWKFEKRRKGSLPELRDLPFGISTPTALICGGFLLFVFLVILAFIFRTLCSQGRHSTTWAIPPAHPTILRPWPKLLFQGIQPLPPR
jgi:hypothetical protein